MNAAFSTLLENRDFEAEAETPIEPKNGEKFRMARRPQADQRHMRPKNFNGLHRRRRKKIRI